MQEEVSHEQTFDSELLPLRHRKAYNRRGQENVHSLIFELSLQGIGYEIARILAEQGFRVAATSRNVGKGNEAAEKMREAVPKATIRYFQLDITDKASVKNCVKEVEQAFGRVDILINNAGMAYSGDVFGPAEAATTIAVNLEGTSKATDGFLRLMGKGSRIVNVCSRYALIWTNFFCTSVGRSYYLVS
jgi:NAD(P)-dependent dehydrogenase (short-subunit alcohol dehydrogenase family)